MDSLHATYDAARRALDAGNLDHAATLLDRMLLLYPHSVDAHQLLGEAYLHARRYHDALDLFKHVLHVDPEHVDALYGLGAAYHYLGDETHAQTAWEQALEIQPNLADLRALVRQVFPKLRAHRTDQMTQAGLARLYMRSDMLDQAIGVLRAEVRAQPQRADLAVALAETLWRANRVADTRRVCYDVLALQPQLVKPTLLLAYILITHNEAGGTALWQRGAAQDPLQTVARSLFATPPAVPAPMPHSVPATAIAAPIDTQQDAPNDDDALLLQLISDIPPGADEVAPPAHAPTTLTMDELLMASGETERTDTDEQPDEPSSTTDPLVTAAADASNNRAPAMSFDTLVAQADTVVAQHTLHLIVARTNWNNNPHGSLKVYKRLVKDGALLDDVVNDLHDLLHATADAWLHQHIYRLLGDAYMRQHRVAEAMQAYAHAFPLYERPQPAS